MYGQLVVAFEQSHSSNLSLMAGKIACRRGLALVGLGRIIYTGL